MYIVGVDSAFDHDLEKALFNIKCNTLSLLLSNGLDPIKFSLVVKDNDYHGKSVLPSSILILF